jgi:hypothetical protein
MLLGSRFYAQWATFYTYYTFKRKFKGFFPSETASSNFGNWGKSLTYFALKKGHIEPQQN